jgi:hypothetical protein
MKCLTAFLLFCAPSFAQDQQDSNPTNYAYEFEIDNVDAQASEAILKDIKVYSKDLFEAHPTFSQGKFKVTTLFPIPENRVRQYLELYGFYVTTFRIEQDGSVLTTKAEQQ